MGRTGPRLDLSTTRPRTRTACRPRWPRCSVSSSSDDPGDLAVRRRRLRLQGAAARPQRAGRCWPRSACRARRSRWRSPGSRCSPSSATARPTLQRLRLGADADGRIAAAGPRGGRADLADQGVRRADHGRHPQHVRRRRPPHVAPARAARRAGAVVDARTGGGPRHVRPGVGDGRAGARPAASTRSSSRIRNEPEADPETGHAVVQPAPRGVPARRAPPASAGRPRRLPGLAARGRLAGRHWVSPARRTPAYLMPGNAAIVATAGTATTRCASAPPTSAPATGPCSPRWPPTPWAAASSSVHVEIGDTDLPEGHRRGRLGRARRRTARRSCEAAAGVPRGARRRPGGRRDQPR